MRDKRRGETGESERERARGEQEVRQGKRE